MRHPNRLKRSKSKRMLKVSGRAQTSQASGRVGVEGLWCRICSPKPYARMDKRTAQDKAAAEQMR